MRDHVDYVAGAFTVASGTVASATWLADLDHYVSIAAGVVAIAAGLVAVYYHWTKARYIKDKSNREG